MENFFSSVADPLPEETEFTRVEEADYPEAGVDTLNDQPMTFAAPNTHSPRRIRRRAAGQS